MINLEEEMTPKEEIQQLILKHKEIVEQMRVAEGQATSLRTEAVKIEGIIGYLNSKIKADVEEVKEEEIEKE